MEKSYNSNRRTWKLSIAYFITIICIIMMTIPAYASAAGRQKRTVKVGAFISSGYHHKNEDGTLDGYGFKYEALLAQYADWDIVYVEGNWSELQQMLADGEIDLLGFLVSTPDRNRVYDYADDASGTSTSCLITSMQNKKYSFENLDSFDGMRIAYQEKNANADLLQSWSEKKEFHIELIPCGSYQELYHAIDTGRADAGLATNFYDLSGYKIIANIGSGDFYYAVTKGNKELYEELNQAVESIKMFYPAIESDLYDEFYESSNGRGAAFTAEENAYISTQPVVTVLAGGRGAPFEICDINTGHYTGFVPDVLDKITEVSGIQFQYKQVENKNAYIQQHGGEPVISSMTCDSSWSTANGWKITQPFLKADVSIITKDGSTEIQTIGLQNENYLKNHIQMHHPNWTILRYQTMEDRLDAVFKGDCDAALMNSYEAEYYLASGKYHLLHEAITSDISQNIGFGVSEGSDPNLFSIVSKSLLMIDSDSYDTMMHKNMDYAGRNNLINLVYTNPVQILTVSVVIILLLAGIIFMLFYTFSIRRKNQQVIAATQVKTDFFSRMSHDMRTPMNGILGMTALSKDENDPKILHHNLEQIETSGQYMLSLINDTLDLQKLESGKMQLNPDKVYAADYIEGLIAMMRPNAENKGIDFKCENININFEKYILLDPTRVKQVFVNLLSNAIKFTPKGGTIRFTSECLGMDNNIEHDRFCVIDTGIGMSQDFIQNNIFHPYSQEDGTITSKYGGTGLGLAIAKNIIDTMGGEISVESSRGKGTCFTVLLNFEVTSYEKKAEPVVKSSEKRKTTTELLAGKRILLCEDHPMNAEIAKRLLKKVGCEVVHACDGKVGVEIFETSEENSFDAILMDIRMPNMDGLTAAKTIRALKRADAQTIPIIAMTANAFEEDIRQCKEAGMNAHLAKPVEPMKMYEELINQI